MRELRLPTGQEPWTWRKFDDREAAHRFFRRLQDGHPPPIQVTEPHLAPDGTIIPEGSWIVLYKPIIFDSDS